MSWYKPHWTDYLGLPLSWGFQWIAQWRRKYLIAYKQKKFSVPIIVIGNLTVGGVGKTPLVIAIAQFMCSKGIKVGIVSRGYKASIRQFPHWVTPNDKADQVGDEPLLIARQTQCPVVIDPQRVRAVDYLLENFDCQLILSDDGLQHYKMGRSIEIAVIDGIRQLGNGFCLPIGPLREPVSRIKTVDFVVINTQNNIQNNMRILHNRTFQMAIEPQMIYTLSTQQPLVDYTQQVFAAIAGIGHPQRFYNSLDKLGIHYKSYVFPDHYAYTADDLVFPEKNVLMTEKDAVKCLDFATDSMYVLSIAAQLDKAFWHALLSHEALQVLFIK